MTQTQTIIEKLNEWIAREEELRANLDVNDEYYTFDKLASLNRSEAYIRAQTDCFAVQLASQ